MCLNHIADGLAGFTLPQFSPVNASVTKFKATVENENDKNEIALVTDMANVAWPGLLAAMSFYLTANLDEELFQNTMRSYQNFTNVCGVLDLVTPRDAFLTNLCKNSIPMIPLLSSGFITTANGSASKINNNTSSNSIATVSSTIANLNTAAISFNDLPIQQQQALANIALNDRNLYSLRVLLNIAMFLNSVLGSSWYLVLETLQLADFLLFNRPTPKGSSTGTAVNVSATPIKRTISGSSTAFNQSSKYSDIIKSSILIFSGISATQKSINGC